MRLSGCGSKQRTKTYSARASYATLAIVGNRAGPSSTGCHSRNSVIAPACRHTSSSSRPSMTGGRTARTAVAREAVGGGDTWGGPLSGPWPAKVTAANNGISSIATPGDGLRG